MSDSHPTIRVWLGFPRDQQKYPYNRHRDLCVRAERAAAVLYSAHGVYFCTAPEDARLKIETVLLYGSRDVHRGRGERLSPERGRLTIDCQALDYRWPLGQIAASSLVIHEVGHILGLPHCKDGCPMATPELAGWTSVLVYWLRRGTRLCEDCTQALREIVVREGT